LNFLECKGEEINTPSKLLNSCKSHFRYPRFQI